MRPAQSMAVFAPSNAQIIQVPKPSGSFVQAGETLVILSSSELELRLKKTKARIEKLKALAAAAMIDQQQRQNLSLVQQELNSAESELRSIETEIKTYQPIASFDGKIYDIDPELQTGSWISNRERIALLVKPDKWLVEAYVDEDAMRRIQTGDQARYFCESDSLYSIPLRVSHIEKDASRSLPNGILSSQSGGSVLVREAHGQIIPELAVYKVTLEVTDLPAALNQHSWRGKIVIQGEWEAPGSRFIRAGLALLSREAGF